MPRILVLHNFPLPFLQHLRNESGDVCFLSEFLNGSEECFEVENDGAGKGEATERLPVNAEVDAGDGELGELMVTMLFVGVARRHEEGFVYLETPGTTLDGTVSWEAGEVARCQITTR